MKMIGMSVRSPATRFCRSSPVRPGSDTSSTRQLGTGARGRSRNSCAEANVSGCQPSWRISGASDSRTEMSSSTMNTIGAALVGSTGGIDRLEKRRVAERLEQALHGTASEQTWTDRLICLGGDIDDRKFRLAAPQLELEIRSAHAGHGDVENQALRLVDVLRRQKLFRRCKGPNCVAEFPQ